MSGLVINILVRVEVFCEIDGDTDTLSRTQQLLSKLPASPAINYSVGRVVYPKLKSAFTFWWLPVCPVGDFVCQRHSLSLTMSHDAAV